ncbi:uncharacterized protein LOC139931139 [Centroberyx gerrardi]|uniref:uncharacterized protein n=1 Tax=Centroberyx gerrardi TaxID=166262 RepID=UPI003AB022AD
MTKRRAEDTLFHDAPSKRCYRSLCSVDMQLESMAATGGVNPPSLLALLGSRCRKRPHYFEDREEQQQQHAALHRKTTHCDPRKHAETGSSVQTSGSFQDRRTSTTLPNSKKRPREDGVAAQTAIPKAGDGADDDSNNNDGDCTYNSFQYWRVPLPELDLSLLEDANNQSEPREKSKGKDSISDAMET